jgi:hypothetical protein
MLSGDFKAMFEIRFGRFIGVFCLTLVFAEIYQHNKIIKLNYEKQRLDVTQNDLKKTYGSLMVELCNLKCVDHVKKVVQEKFGMEKLKYSQVLTFTGF